MKRIFATFTSAFLRGLLFIVPVVVTIYVMVRMFRFIDGLLAEAFGAYLPAYGVMPGLGMLTLVLGITLLGIVGSTIIAQPIIRAVNRLLESAPLVKTLYSALKDLMSAFVGKERRFDRPVLVRIGSIGTAVERIGFVTRTDLSSLGLGPERIAVYLPHSYAWSGNLCIVHADQIVPLAISPADAMKFIVSGGVSGVHSRRLASSDE